MHVPSTPTQELHLLSFAQALQGGGGGDYDREKWIYVPDFYSEYRYILGLRGENPLICLGVNPSTAAPGALDNTLQSVARIATANGFDSWVMLNVYAQRATRPQDMDKCCNQALHRENLLALRHVLTQVGAGRQGAIWAAWGAVIEKRAYLPDCVADFLTLGREFDARWWKAGPISKAGHPHHPLYLRKDTVVEPFDVEQYLEMLKVKRGTTRKELLIERQRDF